jgi:hypothetical protein
VFTRYLIGIDAPPIVLDAYQRAHDRGSVVTGSQETSLDCALLRLARLGAAGTRAADAYAALFARTSVLRRKLVLLVAILESWRRSADLIDTATSESIAGLVLSTAGRALRSAAAAAMAAVVLVPLRIWFSIRKRAASRVVADHA